MSCNGCRVLRKGCSEACVLRESIEWIDGADAQANATVFVAKFVGRSTLLAFLSSVPSPRRPLAFRSLLYEACGRTVNPVNGAMGLLWTGNWQLCQAAVEAVLAGRAVRPMQELATAAEAEDLYRYQKTTPPARKRRKRSSSSSSSSSADDPPAFDLDLCLMPASREEDENWQTSTPSSESSVTTTSTGGSGGDLLTAAEEPALLTLFR